MLKVSATLKGSLWMILAALMFSLMGMLVKSAAKDFFPVELVFYRCLLGLLGIWIVVLARGQTLRTAKLRLHLTRGLIGSGGMLLHFAAIASLPLATAVTLNYTAPLFLTVATIVFFGERPRFLLVLSVVIGFAGILLLLHPVFDQSQSVSGLTGLAAGLCGGLAFLSTRELGRQGEPPWRVVFYFSLVATVLMGTWMLVQGASPIALRRIPALLGIGLCATVAQLAMTRAYRDGQTQIVGSFSYLTVVFTSILGMLFWGEFLAVEEWFGIVLVLASGIAAVFGQPVKTSETKPAGA